MSKVLTAYFSASGTTRQVARRLAAAINSDLFEIVPEVPYTRADLDWTDKHSRTSLEMADPKSRPEVAAKLEHPEQYSVIFLGFPIWWYTAPHIINTFLEQHQWSGQKIVPFCTSGGSGITRACKEIAPSCPGAQVVNGRHFASSATEEELARWASEVL